MASTRIPRPPRWLLAAYLIAALPIAAMLFTLAVLASWRWHEYGTAARMLLLVSAICGGWTAAWRLFRSPR